MGSDLPTPEYWMIDLESRNFEYSSRDSEDYVVSGPLGEASGTGRRFDSWSDAERWAISKFGDRFRGRPEGVSDLSPRWAFVIKGVK